MTDALRLTEILTTSSAIANYLGVPVVDASHLLKAIEVLEGNVTLDDLGRPLSPMLSRLTRAGNGVAPEVQQLAQRWFAELGGDPLAEFDEESLKAFIEEARALNALGAD